jgi:hypothetical protein
MSTVSNNPDRRRLRRKVGKRGTSLTCRKGALGLGKDIAVGLLDITEEGARLLVKEELQAGAEVEITFNGVGVNKRVVALATVVWCMAETGHFAIGVKFRDRMPYVDSST